MPHPLAACPPPRCMPHPLAACCTPSLHPPPRPCTPLQVCHAWLPLRARGEYKRRLAPPSRSRPRSRRTVRRLKAPSWRRLGSAAACLPCLLGLARLARCGAPHSGAAAAPLCAQREAETQAPSLGRTLPRLAAPASRLQASGGPACHAGPTPPTTVVGELPRCPACRAPSLPQARCSYYEVVRTMYYYPPTMRLLRTYCVPTAHLLRTYYAPTTH